MCNKAELGFSVTDAALRYASLGLTVFPLAPGGKVPDTPHGFQDASTNPEQVKNWWKEKPGRNIGIATGMEALNLVVIDLDYHPERGIDGKEFLRSWEAEHGALPKTWTATSATGGMHLYFRGDGSERCSEDKDHETGVDIRGRGGYVVAPPSLHPCGRQYSWDLAPEEINLASADDRVHKFINLIQKKDDEKKKLVLPVHIEEGSRNWTLYQASCSMQSTGFPDEAIEAAILELNHVSCSPSLPEKEVKRIVGSALKREKGGKMEQWLMSGREMRLKILEEMKWMRGLTPR